MTDCPYHLEIASAKRDSIELLLEMLGPQHPKLLGQFLARMQGIGIQWLWCINQAWNGWIQ